MLTRKNIDNFGLCHLGYIIFHYLLILFLWIPFFPKSIYADIGSEKSLQPSVISDELNPIDEQLWRGLAGNDHVAVLNALKNGANIHVQAKPEEFRYNFGDFPPLIVATLLNDEKMVSLLIDNGACLQLPVQNEKTPSPLAAAAWRGSAGIFNLLLERGMVAPEQSANKEKARALLHYTAAGGSMEIFDHLLADGYQLPETAEDKFDLLLAAAQGSEKLFSRLYDYFELSLSSEQLSQITMNASEEALTILYQKSNNQTQREQLLNHAIFGGYGNLAALILKEHPEYWEATAADQVSEMLEIQPSFVFGLAAHMIAGGEVDKIRYILPKLAYHCGSYCDTELMTTVNQATSLTPKEKADFRGYALIGSSQQQSLHREWGLDKERIEQIERHRAYCLDLINSGEVNFSLTSPFGDEENTALRYAIMAEDLTLAKKILAVGADLSVYQQTPGLIMAASRTHDCAFVQELLTAGADPDISDHYGRQTPLTYAVSSDDTELLKVLLAGGADPNNGIEESRSYNQYYPKKNPFLLAIENGNESILKLMLANRTRPLSSNSLGYGVDFAQSKNMTDLVRLIIDSITDLNDEKIREEVFDGDSVLLWALNNNALWLLEKLQLKGKELIPDGYSEEDLLCFYAENEQRSMLSFLFDQGFSTDINCEEQFSLLDIAAYAGNPEVIELLVNHGADINRQAPQTNDHDWGYTESGSGWTPLFFAINSESLDAVTYLLEHGATTTPIGYCEHGEQDHRMTPLIFAVTIEAVEIVAELLKYGADVNQTNENGYSPLMAAVGVGNSRLVRLLLLHGADKSLRHEWNFVASDRIKAIDDETARREIQALIADDVPSF